MSKFFKKSLSKHSDIFSNIFGITVKSSPCSGVDRFFKSLKAELTNCASAIATVSSIKIGYAYRMSITGIETVKIYEVEI